jgi:hypothetical protein
MRYTRYARLILLGTITLGTIGFATTASAQSGPAAPPYARSLSLAGPRFGFTLLNDEVIRKLKERDINVGSTISQFGWQLERQFYAKQGGPTVLNEWVMLVGGLDQGVAIPSLSWLVGLRTQQGAEFGIGPNVTPAGVGLVVSTGVTFRAGVLNIPMNFALATSKSGARVSLMTGFVLRH